MLQEIRDRGQLTAEETQYIKHTYFVSACRRAIRDPATIRININSVFEHFGNHPYHLPGDPEKGTEDRDVSVVTARTRRVWEKLEPHLGEGCIQDPPGKDMYIEKPFKGQ